VQNERRETAGNEGDFDDPALSKGLYLQTGKKNKVWYAMFRIDLKTEDGGLTRKQKNVRLGTLAELPTKSAAQAKLSEMMSNHKSEVELTFGQLSAKMDGVDYSNPESHYRQQLRRDAPDSHYPCVRESRVNSINRSDVEVFLAGDVEVFLAGKARQGYRRNTLKSLHAALSAVLGWAVSCDWIDKNVCAGIKLPRPLTPEKPRSEVLRREQVINLSEKLAEPYATLVLFLDATGTRIGEAIGLKASDIDAEGNVHICRRIYDGKADTPKTKNSNRTLPLGGTELLGRLRSLGTGYIFASREGTPVNPGNALKRYIRPAARDLGIGLSGWDAFRLPLLERAGGLLCDVM
jgi:hypothetical protein